MSRRILLGLVTVVLAVFCTQGLAKDEKKSPETKKLKKEVKDKGWIAFTGRSARGDFDIFTCRPDGTELKNRTKTAAFDEYGPRWSPDGTKMLFRRAAKGGEVNHDTWGTLGSLIIARADGKKAVPAGEVGELHWASWSADGKKVACLFKRQGKIKIYDLEEEDFTAEYSRNGIFQQLFWSPDEKDFIGTGNIGGADWNIVKMNLETKKATKMSSGLNCTPDWFQKEDKIINSRRIVGNDGGVAHVGGEKAGYGWTDLVMVSRDGANIELIYFEPGKHAYFGRTSPDDKYVIFSRLQADASFEAPMAVMRIADAPIKVGPNKAVPKGKAVLYIDDAGPGFEPDWTYADINKKK